MHVDLGQPPELGGVDTVSSQFARTTVELAQCSGFQHWNCKAKISDYEHTRQIKRLSKTQLTENSGLVVSRVVTARITPDRHSHSEILPIFSFPGPLTDKNLFPTNSSLHFCAIFPSINPFWRIY